MNAGELRELLEGVADDAKVGIDNGFRLIDIIRGEVIASDCLPEPLGSDPETEPTVGVVLLLIDSADLLSESETPDEPKETP